MQQLIDEYNERKEEINCYYNFLRKITSSNYALKNVRTKQNDCLDSRIFKILKANTFLLLYNLIESTVHNSVRYISQEIAKENIQYDSVVEGLKKQWAKVQARQHLQSTNEEKIRDGLKIVIEKTLDEYIQFEGDYKIKYRDNIDADVLFCIARDFGFKLNFAKPLRGGYRIKEIKDKRNYLAHGNITFSNCGQDTTMEDLTIYKNDTYGVLEKFLNTVDKYIKKKQFKKA